MQRAGAEGQGAFGAAFNRRADQRDDVYSKELILQWLLKMNRDYHTTLVVSSGELEELLRICDRIAVMHQGKVFKIFDNNNTSLEELTLALYGRELK